MLLPQSLRLYRAKLCYSHACHSLWRLPICCSCNFRDNLCIAVSNPKGAKVTWKPCFLRKTICYWPFGALFWSSQGIGYCPGLSLAAPSVFITLALCFHTSCCIICSHPFKCLLRHCWVTLIFFSLCLPCLTMLYMYIHYKHCIDLGTLHTDVIIRRDIMKMKPHHSTMYSIT